VHLTFGPQHLRGRTCSLQLVAGGLSNRAVGQQLGISENTVKNHVRSLLEKLHLGSRTAAAMYAVREGLVDS
jgi:DNA-binding NarL/FixJ family response regulator